ncbi:hypothetical protein PICMEDRAFT_122506 [Pichia membranifaciens NRRL Y-2026]|uniref:Transcription regulator Rua1 C-terminal domain-containing protein n=1 Tax=Pichia membranifaciens NRRL Y-2026 TaxID=763406 RepID=A0A1E3NPR4_9ASCO|nr:hypothetical protein PICMEDRAFT_122506 [Pichia membranifaciens NRRL Y-2026]ODQ48016.1 hypothetical protein PICMEDRAFT_122506 [Pichia membranifaciens NRRL Y-2026]
MKYSDSHDEGSITLNRFSKIDDMFADFFPSSKTVDDLSVVELSPTNSTNTRSADSTVENLTQPSSATTVSTSRLNNSETSLDKLQEALCDEFSNQLSSIATLDNKFEKSLFDPYVGFFPCPTDEDLALATADPIEIFFPTDGIMDGFSNKNMDLYERHNSADNHQHARKEEQFFEKPERNYTYSTNNNSHNVGPAAAKVSKKYPRRSHLGDAELFFRKSSTDPTSLVNIPQSCESVPAPTAYVEKSQQVAVPNIHHSTQPSSPSLPRLASWKEDMNNVPENCLPTHFEPIDDLPKIKQSKHRCKSCFKVSKTSYGCAKQIVRHLPNIRLYKEYNTPNGYTMEYAKQHGDSQYVYMASEVKNEYDPLVKRYTMDIQYNSKGKKLKRDYPSLCPFCKVSDSRKFDSLFYERNNSCYRGHLINTHGINSMGEFAKLPESGFVCYKLGKNSWSETVGFKCPYENCDFCFLRGDKTHGFHEYIRHWNRSHIE